MADQNGFFLYLDQYEPIAELNLEQKGMLLEAFFAFNRGEAYEIADPVVRMAFGFFKTSFDREKQKYAEICNRRKEAARSRWDANAPADKKSSDEVPENTNVSDEKSRMQTMQMDANDANASFAMQTMPKPDPEPDPEPENKREEKRATRAVAPPCPHKQLVELYHEILPTLPRVKVWDSERERNMQARWRERWESGKYTTQEEGLAYWRRLFAYIHGCPWLMGEVADRDGKAFRADLGWIILPRNFKKIIEGRYDQRQEIA